MPYLYKIQLWLLSGIPDSRKPFLLRQEIFASRFNPYASDKEFLRLRGQNGGILK